MTNIQLNRAKLGSCSYNQHRTSTGWTRFADCTLFGLRLHPNLRNKLWVGNFLKESDANCAALTREATPYNPVLGLYVL